MQKKNKKIIMLTILLLIIIAIIILMLNKTNPIPQPLAEQAKAEYTTQIGDQTYDITNAVLESNEITPTLSAGMIPVKWNGTNWVITTQNDANWYNYQQGQPAYIMLNDGIYQSELVQNMTGKKLASDNVGNDALVVPEVSNNNPTIYMWIPRFAYNNQGEILYIKQGCSVAGTYTMPKIFIYETATRDFSLAGIWVEYNPLSNTSEVNTKINNMQGENNQYGFIANTIAINANNEASYKTTIENYINALSTVAGTDDQWSPLQENTNKLYESNTIVGAGIARSQLGDISNPNRTILKITNTNQLEPIKGNAHYDTDEEKIKIEVTYRTNAITKILNSKGNVLSENSLTADTGDEIIGNKIYKYMVLDNLGNIKEISTEVSGLDVYIIENEIDLKFFRDAVNARKTTAKTKAYQIADVKMNEGKYTINEKTGEITFSEDAEKWTGITTTYYGKYYGNNYTINGIYGNIGLFDKCDGAEIKDLGIVESYIIANNSTGAILGYSQNNTILENCYSGATIEVNSDRVGGLIGTTYNNSTTTQVTLNNCYNKGKILIKSSKTLQYIGGIVGNPYNAKVSNCYNVGEIINESTNTCNYVGGIVGYLSYGSIKNSYNTANIEKAGNYIGGIGGNTGSDSLVNNCYNTGNVSGAQHTAGICGVGNVNYCYNIGNVTGTQYVAGICANLSARNSDNFTDLYNYGNVLGDTYVAGIADHASNLKNCYNVGNVNGNNNIGGIVVTPGSIQNCYNAGEVNGANYVGGIMAGTNGNGGGDIKNTYNIGNVTGTRYVGGIRGYLRNSGTIYDSYNLGNIVAQNNVGAILGYTAYTSGVTLSGNYYKRGTASSGNNGKDTGAEPLDEMPSIISIINSENDFIEDVYDINNGFPILSWQTDNDKLNLINGDNAFVEDKEGINRGYPILAWQVEEDE